MEKTISMRLSEEDNLYIEAEAKKKDYQNQVG